MKTITLNILASDFVGNSFHNDADCPIARAIKRAGHGFTHVSVIDNYKLNSDSRWEKVNENVQRMFGHFDTLEPKDFSIEVPLTPELESYGSIKTSS